MKVISKKDIKSAGKFILIYGETGCGKTTTIIQTAPDPILYIGTEPRNPKPSIDAANRPNVDLDVVFYETWVSLMEFLSEPKNTARYKTIAIDSITYLMTVSLTSELEDEAYDARSDAEKRIKPLVNMSKMTMESYGGLSSQMFRLCKSVGRLSTEGKVVIVTALLAENPKWDRSLAAAPALKGKEFPTSFPGFLDLIGKVEPRLDENDNIVYPPYVSFESPDDSFLAKFTGAGKKRSGPLNFEKILKG